MERLKNGNHAGTMNEQGYIYVRVTRDGKRVSIMKHRLVMEEMLGRRLYPFENVHHLNGVRHDNRPENLELWTKPQLQGQRPIDLARWVVATYPDEVRRAESER